MEGFFHAAGPWAYVVLFIVVAGETSAFLGLLAPGEVVLLTAGAFAGNGNLDLTTVLIVAAAGALVGDAIGYILGRTLGDKQHSGWLGRVWSSKRRAKAQRFFERNGKYTIIASRFVGFVRPLGPFTAGAVRMPILTFVALDGVAAITWSIGSVLLGYFLGEAAERILKAVGLWGAVAFGAVIVVVLVVRKVRRGRLTESPHSSTDRAAVS